MTSKEKMIKSIVQRRAAFKRPSYIEWSVVVQARASGGRHRDPGGRQALSRRNSSATQKKMLTTAVLLVALRYVAAEIRKLNLFMGKLHHKIWETVQKTLSFSIKSQLFGQAGTKMLKILLCKGNYKFSLKNCLFCSLR